MKRTGVLLGIFVVVALAGIAACNFGVSFPQAISTASAQTSAAPQEQAFVSQVGAGVDINEGITILGPGPQFGVGNSASDRTAVSFFVFNHTDEAIAFHDQTFGLMVFSFDNQTSKWKTIILPKQPNLGPKTLRRKLETFDPAITNEWFIDASELPKLADYHLRLYVQGVGTATGKKYGAYLDATLTP